ncbi:MAG: Maf family protein [Gemmatimonadota bacterium]|jgi:septum formation protein
MSGASGDGGAVPPIILASSSPRRRRLLEMLGLDFRSVPSEIEEVLQDGEDTSGHVERLAREKALAVAASYPDALVIGGDTIVVVDRTPMGKPESEADAVAMLLRLQGAMHRVETGVAVIAPGGQMKSSVVRVRVWFRAFDQRTAVQYVSTGEPMDKAGAYGIQGYGATLVDRIDGDYFAVMGLPLARLVSLLRAVGWHYTFRGIEAL